MANIRKLSPELAKIAKDLLNEDEHRMLQDLNYIKEWISKQPHLKSRTDDQWLVAFLRKNKHSLEATKTQIDLFYTLRTMMPEFFKNRDPLESPLKDIISQGLFLTLENHSNEIKPIVLFYHIEKDAALFDMNTLLKYHFMMLDILLNENDNFTVNGMTVICDLQNVTLSYISQFTPTIAKRCITAFFDGYPVNLLGVHFINIPNGFLTLYDMLKTLIPLKYRERFFLHKNVDELYKYFSQDNFPVNYGGKGKDITEITNEWQKSFESHRKWFLEDEEYGCNENLRPGEPKTSELLFGINGSFRKLTLD